MRRKPAESSLERKREFTGHGFGTKSVKVERVDLNALQFVRFTSAAGVKPLHLRCSM